MSWPLLFIPIVWFPDMLFDDVQLLQFDINGFFFCRRFSFIDYSWLQSTDIFIVSPFLWSLGSLLAEILYLVIRCGDLKLLITLITTIPSLIKCCFVHIRRIIWFPRLCWIQSINTVIWVSRRLENIVSIGNIPTAYIFIEQFWRIILVRRQLIQAQRSFISSLAWLLI